jgi:hypothetical protein
MTRAEFNNAIVAAWAAEAPVTDERALELAQGIYDAERATKEKDDFIKWFRRNGATAVTRVNQQVA